MKIYSVPYYHRFKSLKFFSQGAIVIHEVYEDGAAAKDGRLWAGDQILEVRLSIFVVMCFICSVFVPIKKS